MSLQRTASIITFWLLWTLKPLCVVPLLDSLLEAKRYVKVRALLNETLGLLEDKSTKTFFDSCDLGDRNPSEVMDYLLCLQKEEKPGFLQFAFKHFLPPVHQSLAGYPSKDLCAFAKQANRLMMDLQDPPSPVASLVLEHSPTSAPLPC